MKASIRMLGVITLLFEAGMLLALVSSRSRMDGPLTTSAIVRVSIFFSLATLVAIGLFLLRKWAAILFGASAGAVATWMLVGTVVSVPSAFWVLNFMFAFLLILPIAVIVRSWSPLPWRGKWLL